MRTLTTRSASADVVTRIASVAATAAPNVFIATLSTNSDVRRSGYTERLERWNNFPPRVPLLDSHRRDSVDSVIGYADNIRSENGSVVADLHVSSTRQNVATVMSEGGAARRLNRLFRRDLARLHRKRRAHPRRRWPDLARGFCRGAGRRPRRASRPRGRGQRRPDPRVGLRAAASGQQRRSAGHAEPRLRRRG